MTTSSSLKSAPRRRSFAPTVFAEPTKALRRIGSSIASSAGAKPRAAIASGDCSGPSAPRCRSMRQRSRDSARWAAASSVSAARAQTQSVACGSGCRSLG
jgi:hypothetical protein